MFLWHGEEADGEARCGVEEGAVPVVGTLGDAMGAGAGARAGRTEAGAETWGHACSPPAGCVR